MTENNLGEFLRARRSLLGPGDVGLPSYGPRRVAGLRREEVAALAGMNSDYYARLEQGRERSPSGQVLEAMANALRLDTPARDHLYRLAGAVPGTRQAPRETISEQLRFLLDGYASVPAFVLNPAKDVMAVNALAGALFSPFRAVDNLARMTFADPAARHFFADWDRFAESIVAGLRHAAGVDPDYHRLREVVGALEEESGTFAALWSAQTVYGKSLDPIELVHPDVGPLSLMSQSFDVRGATGQLLVIYQPEPGGPSARALTLLGTLDATRRRQPVAGRGTGS
ncbi:helix-turn-helix transcriptional regulator [Symbioplanes lichenis]|uniref:helix-turn-helix transcriptional regulator n=1 Tax=Symbioplanes lichenis TaxID=1629072 RepID=UPI002738708D|nr:helix-turn-helix transcriptional regulator [Actinoplanes lichenis]